MCSCKRGTSKTVTVSQPKQTETSKTSQNSPTRPAGNSSK